MKKLFTIITFLFLANLSIFSQNHRIYNFFGYNCWKHIETLEDGKKITTVRAIFDDTYYIYQASPYFEEDEYGFAIKDHSVNVSSNVTVYDLGDQIRFEIEEPPLSWEIYTYNIENGIKHLYIQDNVSEKKYAASDMVCVNSGDLLCYNYTISRPVTRKHDKKTYQNETIVCQDVFYNKSRDYLYHAIASSVYSLLDFYYDESFIDNIKYMQLPELRVMRNALYACKGYKFKSKELQEIFYHFSWYHPYTSNENDISFSEKEQKILDAILERTEELKNSLY